MLRFVSQQVSWLTSICIIGRNGFQFLAYCQRNIGSGTPIEFLNSSYSDCVDSCGSNAGCNIFTLNIRTNVCTIYINSATISAMGSSEYFGGQVIGTCPSDTTTSLSVDCTGLIEGLSGRGLEEPDYIHVRYARWLDLHFKQPPATGET